MGLLYVGDLVSVQQDGVERVGRVESFSSHRACTHVGVNLGQGVEWIVVRDVFAVIESVGPRKATVVSDGSTFNKAGVRPPGHPHAWRASDSTPTLPTPGSGARCSKATQAKRRGCVTE